MLRSMELGEADRVLSVLTPRLGKLKVIAKGVRRPRSRIGGGLQPFSDVQLVLAVGRTFDVVTSSSLEDPHLGLRNDRPVLRETCVLAQTAGILLCASSPAQGEPVYPASYPGVIRITGDARCAPGQWSWLNSPQADFGAHVAAANGLAGSSVGCAALSGIIAGYLQSQPGANRDAVLHWLRDSATFIGPERRGHD